MLRGLMQTLNSEEIRPERRRVLQSRQRPDSCCRFIDREHYQASEHPPPPIALALALYSALYARSGVEKHFDTEISIDGQRTKPPTHSVDCFKNRVALEIEWNNKDPFYDRDLNNFWLLFDLRVASVGVIITRCDDLQDIFKELGRGNSFGASTTHMRKLLPRIAGGGGGGCPLLVFGITKSLYVSEGQNR